MRRLSRLKLGLLHLWCLVAGHWWEHDEDGGNPHCGRCGEAAW